MCTVTYLPNPSGNFILTSSRDEKIVRPTRPPSYYYDTRNKYCFPKDELAGGTWISMSETGRVCTLLNGAFEKHIPTEKHTKSRGQVVVETLYAESALKYLFETGLEKVEPFTMVIAETCGNELPALYEFRWNGKEKYQKSLDPLEPHIWSSVTLYDSGACKLREKWFVKWLADKTQFFEAEAILKFHKTAHTNNRELNILMQQRDDRLKTVSITQVVKKDNTLQMVYHDLLGHKTQEFDLNIHEWNSLQWL